MVKKEVKKTEAAGMERYTKKQLTCSEKYCNQSDLICALLEDEKVYSLTEANEIMSQFMRGKVKVC